jgi:hypothetical protein
MHTDLTSGAPYERTGRLYVWSRSRSKRKRRNSLDLCTSQSPLTPAQARLTVGGAHRGHGASLAAGRQKHRSPPGLTLGCGLVCPLGGVDAGEAPQRTRNGSVRVGECRGPDIYWPPGRPHPPDSRSFQHCPGLCGPGQRWGGGDQWVDPACGPRLWLCRCPPPLVRYHGTGVAYWVSQRTRDLAGLGPALWSRPGEAQNPRGGGGRCCTGAGADNPQDGQRTPSVGQGHTGQAPGVDALAHRGGPVGRADTPTGPGARRASRPCDAARPDHAEDDARGGQAPRAADGAVDQSPRESSPRAKSCMPVSHKRGHWCATRRGKR